MLFTTKRVLHTSHHMESVIKEIGSMDLCFMQTTFQVEAVQERKNYRFTPVQQFRWFHNSFAPAVQILLQESSDGCTLELYFALHKWVKIFSYVYCSIAAIFQIAILVMTAEEKTELIPMMLPAVLCAFDILFTYLSLHIGAAVITKEIDQTIRVDQSDGQGTVVR